MPIFDSSKKTNTNQVLKFTLKKSLLIVTKVFIPLEIYFVKNSKINIHIC